jgi:Fe-S cluster assembly ATP-binding protein
MAHRRSGPTMNSPALLPAEQSKPASNIDASAGLAAADRLLELRGIGLRLGAREVLRGLDLAVAEGEMHVLLGANGSGKSSLAYLIMGCEGYTPGVGEVLFEGKCINALPIHERARLGITLAWQEPARFEGISVGSYLTLGKDAADPGQHLEAVGLQSSEYLHRPLDKTLSGGERKRIELAAILAMRPRLAILDEPSAGIDLLSMDQIVRLIEAMRTARTTVLLITHQEELALHADHASQLCGGRIVATGTAAAVTENYRARLCRRCDGVACSYA